MAEIYHRLLQLPRRRAVGRAGADVGDVFHGLTPAEAEARIAAFRDTLTGR